VLVHGLQGEVHDEEDARIVGALERRGVAREVARNRSRGAGADRIVEREIDISRGEFDEGLEDKARIKELEREATRTTNSCTELRRFGGSGAATTCASLAVRWGAARQRKRHTMGRWRVPCGELASPRLVLAEQGAAGVCHRSEWLELHRLLEVEE